MTKHTQAVALVNTETWSAKQAGLYPLCQAMFTAGAKFADTYREAIRYIHDNEMSPAESNPVFLAAGFHKSAASRFNTIANADPKTYKDYITGDVSFRPSLNNARQTRAAKSGRKRKNAAGFGRLSQLHRKLVHVNPKLIGNYLNADNVLLCLPLARCPHTFTFGNTKVTVTAELKQ